VLITAQALSKLETLIVLDRTMLSVSTIMFSVDYTYGRYVEH